MKKPNSDTAAPMLRLIAIGPDHDEDVLNALFAKETAQEVTLGIGEASVSLNKVTLKNGEEAYILGDGKNFIPLASLNNAISHVAKGGRIDILGHGGHEKVFGKEVKPYERTHELDLVTAVPRTLGVAPSIFRSNATEVHFWSCYGGTDRKKLLSIAPINTTVYLHSGAAHTTMVYDSVAGILQPHTPPHEEEVFTTLRNYIRASPETMNVIHKFTEDQAVWMHVPFPKPDNPEHINEFLHNHIQQNLNAADQLESFVNPDYVAKQHLPLTPEELALYREKTKELVLSRELPSTLGTFLRADIPQLAEETKKDQLLSLIGNMAGNSQLSNLKTFLSLRHELGIDTFTDDQIVESAVTTVTNEIQQNNTPDYLEDLLNSFIKLGIFHFTPETAEAGRELFSEAFVKTDNPVCNRIIHSLVNADISSTMESEPEFVIDLMKAKPKQFATLLDQKFLHEQAISSPIVQAMLNHPELETVMQSEPALARSCAKLIFNASMRDASLVPTTSNTALSAALHQQLPKGQPLPKGLPIQETTDSPPISTISPASSSTETSLPVGIRPPFRRMHNPTASSSVPIMDIQSVCRVKDILKALPAIIEAHNQEHQTSIVLDENALITRLSTAAYGVEKHLGRNSIIQAPVAEHGTVKPAQILNALQETLQTDTVTTAKLFEQCKSTIKAAHQKG